MESEALNFSHPIVNEKTENNHIAKKSTKPINRKSLAINIAVIVFLVVANVLVSSSFRQVFSTIMWESDDATHIDVAHSFQVNKNFNRHYLQFSGNQLLYPSDLYQTSPTVEYQEREKGPLYYVLLGSFYQLFGAEGTDLYFYGSIFSTICSSIFLVLFFVLIQRHFSLKIASLSSLSLLIIPFFDEFSSRVVPEMLIFVFVTSALFFIKKEKKQYFIFGIFVGLAHITHPFGMLIGLAYCFFLLLNKEFKGFLLTIIGWHLVLLPWLIRNYYLFKDIGWGLYLPLSTQISQLFDFSSKKTIIPDVHLPVSSFLLAPNFDPYHVAVVLFQGISQYTTMGIFAFFVLVSFFTFFDGKSVKNTHKILIISLIVNFYLIISFVDNWILRFVSMFIIPFLIIYLLWKHERSVFLKPIPRFYKIVILFVFVTLFCSYLLQTIIQRDVPEYRPLEFSMMYLIPLSLLGIVKLYGIITTRTDKKIFQEKSFFTGTERIQRKLAISLRQKLSPFIFLSLILSTLAIPMGYDVKSFRQFILAYPDRYDNQMLELNEWVTKNIPNQNILLASTQPAFTTDYTGIDSVSMPFLTEPLGDQSTFEKFVSDYNASYLVIYHADTKPWYDPKEIFQWPALNYTYITVYSAGNSSVIKVIDLTANPDITHPYLYLIKTNRILDKNPVSAFKLFHEVRTYLDGFLITEKSPTGPFSNSDQVSRSLVMCNSAINYYESNLEKQPNLDNTALQKSLIDLLYIKATLLTMQQNYDDAEQPYLDIIRLDMFQTDAHIKLAKLYEKQGRFADELRQYEFLYHISPSDSNLLKKIEQIKKNIANT